MRSTGGWRSGEAIPESVIRIGERIFFLCLRLTSVTLPESLTHIGGDVFAGCVQLKPVTIPKSVTSFGAPTSDGWEEVLAVLRSRGQYHGGSIFDIKYR